VDFRAAIDGAEVHDKGHRHLTRMNTEKGADLERVAGVLEVSRTADARAVVLRHADWQSDENIPFQIVLSPRQARHLSSLLVMHAEEVEQAYRDSSTTR
jgi:hypothetical protein